MNSGIFQFPIFLLLVGLISCSAGGKLSQKPTVKEYQILHTNDFHSQYQSFRSNGLPCNLEEEQRENCVGGMSRLIAKVNEIKGGNKNVLVFDAGDLSQGNLFSEVLKEKPASWFANHMGYDAQTLGNHEFDEGKEYLVKYISALHNPYVNSNLGLADEPEMRRLIKNNVILDKDGEKIGVLGLLTNEANDVIPHAWRMILRDEKTVIANNVENLKQEGVNKVILLSHIGFEEDLNLASEVCGIDVIVGGHSHTFLSNVDANAVAEYPIVATSACGDPIAIVTAGSRGKYLGNLAIGFDAGGILTKAEGEPILMDAKLRQDPAAVTELTSWLDKIKPFYQKILGYTDIDLPVAGDVCRFGECAIGNVVADAMMWSYRDRKPDFAMLNAGSIRGGIGRGPIYLANVYDTLPFQNATSICKLKGSVVKAMLEHGVSRAESSTKEGTGRFPQVSGLRFTWDVNEQAGQRIKEVLVIKDGSEEPLDSEDYYTIVVPDFVRKGGDGYEMLKTGAIEAHDYGPIMAESLINYLEAKKRIKTTGAPRIIGE